MSQISLKQVGNQIVADNANWSFGGEVAVSFDAHVEKSVPLYHEGHQLAARIADFKAGREEWNERRCVQCGIQIARGRPVLVRRRT